MLHCPNKSSALYKALMKLNNKNDSLATYQYNLVSKLQDDGLLSLNRFKPESGKLEYTIPKIVDEKSIAKSFKGESPYAKNVKAFEELDKRITLADIDWIKIKETKNAYMVEIVPRYNKPGDQTTLFQTSKKSGYSESLEAGLEWAKKVFPNSDVKLVEGLIQDIARGSYNSVEDVISASKQFADKGTIKHEFGHKAFARLTEKEREDLLNEGSKLFNIPRGEGKSITKFQQVEYQFKAVEKITNSISRIERLWNQIKDKEIFWKKIGQELGISKEQIELLKNSDGNTIEEKLTSFLANYSYTVEINTAKNASEEAKKDSWKRAVEQGLNPWEEGIDNDFKGENTQHYSNLTVPGGTNYTENEIATPAIVPSIKGHAQFATDNGIGWFRSDEAVDNADIEEYREYDREYPPDHPVNRVNTNTVGGTLTKTRRILEVQSDLFQKGRDKAILSSEVSDRFNNEDSESFENRINKTQSNKFLQLLNKDNNWVTFFVKSIIQDSAKKGYEKVLFPTGDTASKVEGHTTLEEFKKQKGDRIRELEEGNAFMQKQVDNYKSINKIGDSYTTLGLYGDKELKNIDTKEKFDNVINHKNGLQKSIDSNQIEINQLKQELERVEKEGFAALRPIYNFYENTVSNILKKQGYNPNLITDEYGNTWNEIEIKPEMANEAIKFQTSKLEYSGDLAIEEKIMELMEKSPDRIVAKSAIGKFFQKLKQFLRDVFNSQDKIGNFIKDVNEGRFSEREVKNTSKEIKYQKTEDWNDNQGSAFEQQQRFFKRRIADLNKKLDKLAKYSKEWLELKKSINELKLNVKEAALRQDENLYFELGKEILQDVANFIEELKVGTRNPTDRYLDYTLEVLSTWSDFPGLETEVNRLRKKVFPFVEESNKEKVNQYATEGREITKEDIDKQDEDIRKLFNLGSRFLGSLSDSASYLGRTIGALIKEAQNTASSESKKTRDVIQTEVDELYQWAIRNGVKPINMYDVFIQVDGTNSKLTQPHFADGRVNLNYEKIQSSPELSRFYKFYQDTMEAQQVDFPFKPGKNWIPNIKATSIKRTLQDINPVKERTLKPGSITEEYLPDDVPIKYLKNIPASEKSTDLGNSLLAFTRHSNEFKQLSDVLPQIRLLQEGIKYKLVNGTLTDRKYKKGSNPNLSVNGEDSDLYKMTEDVIKMQVLGQMKKEEGKVVINDTSDNDGNIKQTYFDTTSLIDNLLKWNSLLRVGLSPINSTINVLVGDSQNILESIGGRFFGFKDLTTATQIFFKQTLHKDSTLNTILETAGVLQEMEDYEAISTSVGAKTLTKEKLQEYVYSLQKAGEKYLQSRTLLAMMLKEEYLTLSGNVTPKWNNLSTHDKNKFIDKVQRVNIMTHGRYSAREASTLQQGVVFRMVSQFRKWVFSGIENRVAGKSYDNRLGMEFEGRYVTYLSLIKELAKYKGQLEGGRKLTELEVYNLRKGLTEIVLILAMIAMYGLVGGDDEEARANRKNPVFKTALTLLNRVSEDLAFFYSAESLTQLAGNAIPMLKLVNDVRVIPGMLVDGLLGKDMNYKTGSRKDRNKLVTKFEQITPGLKEIDTFSRLANKQSLEELRPK